MQNRPVEFRLPDRDWKTDHIYGVLGRALVLAADFETNCSKLALRWGLGSLHDPMASEDIERLTESMRREKLHQKIGTIGKSGAGQEGVDALHKAREARNRLVHDTSFLEPLLFGTARDADSFLDWLVGIVEDIVDGNFRVLGALAADDIGNAAMEQKLWSRMVSYPERAMTWVMRESLRPPLA